MKIFVKNFIVLFFAGILPMGAVSATDPANPDSATVIGDRQTSSFVPTWDEQQETVDEAAHTGLIKDTRPGESAGPTDVEFRVLVLDIHNIEAAKQICNTNFFSES